MPIINTLFRSSDVDKLTVGQATDYTLYFLSKGQEILLETKVLEENITYTFPINKDGKYKVLLEVVNETDVILNFNVTKFLQNSIIKDTQVIVCCEQEVSDCNESSLCITELAKKCLKTKLSFTKLLTCNFLYIPYYGITVANTFYKYFQTAILENGCGIQNAINNILADECITGSSSKTQKLFRFYFAVFWYGMYRIEYNEAITDEDKAFVKLKYKYNTIIECICDLCIDADTLSNIYDDAMENILIYYWQYDNVNDDINDAPNIDQTFLDTKSSEVIDNFLAGKTVSYTDVGRIGFAITNVPENYYKILDTFGVNITSVVFDSYYDNINKIQIYISKSVITISDIYFKFILN